MAMYIHDLSPFLWQMTDTFGIQWNGLSYMVAFLLSFVFVGWMAFRQRSELTPKLLGDFVTSSAIGVLIGARVGYCLFYSPDLFLKFRPDFPFLGVLALGEGGMSAHGGIIGLFLVGTLFALKTGVSRLYLFDLMAVTAPLGLLLGRLANFVSSEFIGAMAPSHYPLAMKFPSEILTWWQSQPERLAELAPLAMKVSKVSNEQWKQWLQTASTLPDSKQSLQQILSQIIEAIQAGQLEIRNSLAPLLFERHPFQLYAALAEGLLLFLFLFILWHKPRKPGVIAASFLVFYSLIRIFEDRFRMTDPTAALGVMGFSRVQVLSLILLVIGLILLFVWGRRETLPFRGWGRGHSVKLHRH